MSNIAIRLSSVGKKYTINKGDQSLLRSLVSNQNSKDFWALKNINLTIKQGDQIGIVGSNGAGKTTLLKIIAGITQPSIGKVTKYGTVASLIHLDAGFHPDLTGLENLPFNGMLLGMTKHEIAKKKNASSSLQVSVNLSTNLFTNTPQA